MLTNKPAKCPFCGCDRFGASVTTLDLAELGCGNDITQSVIFSCLECQASIFQVWEERGGHISVFGVQVCEKCCQPHKESRYAAENKTCRKCGSEFTAVWWYKN